MSSVLSKKISALLFAVCLSCFAYAQCSGGQIQGTIFPSLSPQTTGNFFPGSYFSLNAAMGVTYDFSFCSSDGGSQNFDTEITLLDANGNFAGAYNNDHCGTNAKLTWLCTASGFYRILVTASGCVTSNSLTADMAYKVIAPWNDDCSSAIPVQIPGTVFGNTSFAQADVAPVCSTTDGSTGGVWYSVMGTGGVITASLCNGTNYDSRIRIFTGGCNALECVAGNDDFCGTQSQTNWCSLAGRMYYILVHGWLSTHGSFTLELSSTAPTPVPVASASATSICAGDSVVLTASGGVFYYWTPIDGLENPAWAVAVARPDSSTDYILALFDQASGCTQYDTVSVQVNPVPLVQISGPSPVCPDDSALLIASGALNYAWQHGPLTDMVTVYTSSSQDYIVSGTDINGCTAVDTFVLAVYPFTYLSVSGNTHVCEGNSATLTASGSFVNYNWSTGDSTNTITVNPVADTSFTVTAIDANGCSSSMTWNMTVNPVPLVSSYAMSNPVCMTDAPVQLGGLPLGGTWYGAGISPGDQFDPAQTGSGTHDIVYVFTDGNGCSGMDTLPMIVDACTGITENKNDFAASVYPNPGNGTFKILLSQNDEITIELIDMNGRIVYRKDNVRALAGSPIEIQTEISEGLYTLRISNETKQETIRLIVSSNQ